MKRRKTPGFLEKHTSSELYLFVCWDRRGKWGGGGGVRWVNDSLVVAVGEKGDNEVEEEKEEAEAEAEADEQSMP